MTSLRRDLLGVLFLFACNTIAIPQDAGPPSEFKIPGEKLADFVGQYVYDDDPDLPRSLSLAGSRLFIESLRTAKSELLAQSEETFAPNNVPVTFKFLRSAEGKVIGFNRINAEGTAHATKISDRPLQFNKLEYTRQEVMVPMRDGIKLHAVILRPKDYVATLPRGAHALWSG